MSVREALPESGTPSNPEDADEDERRRLSVFDLVGLAVGGVIGSGWLLAAVKADRMAGFSAVASWAIGGALMMVIAVVMVELGAAAPKTGGLVFLPLQSSGPLVATIVAAALWVFYAINQASEAAAMTRGLSFWFPGLSESDPADPSQYVMTVTGMFCAVLFMALIVALNLLAQQVLLKVNFLLTVWKVVIPVLVVGLLIASGFDRHGLTARQGTHGSGLGAALAAVIGSGIIYAYVGFQAPLDFAGNVRRRGIGETARLRWAVYGTVAGSTVLYILLQIVYSGHHGGWTPGRFDSPYTQFALAVSITWIIPLLRINSLLSPLGSGLVFSHALTREVAALSRAHLTHRGLQTADHASIKVRDRDYDVYWMVLLVDLAIGLVALVSVRGSWGTLAAISGVLTTVIYAMPGVVLVAFHEKLAMYSPWRGRVHHCLALVGFVLMALVMYWAGWSSLWKGMAALAMASMLLLWLPVLARWELPLVGRLLRPYDAKEHVTLLRELGTTPAVDSAAWLTGYLAVLTLLTLAGKSSVGFVPEPVGSFLIVGIAVLAFYRLVDLSRKHIGKVPPKLPERAPKSPARRATGGND